MSMIRRPRRRHLFALARGTLFAACLIHSALVSWTARAADPDAASRAFFEKEVRPLLAENCVKCHGPEKQKGGLRLDSRESVLQGGESGPAVVPGKLDESLLVDAVRYDGLQMPPTGQLKPEQVETLTRWVKIGAPWPEDGHSAIPSASSATRNRSKITDEDRGFWSFQPVRRPEVPEVADKSWARNSIDRFVARSLEKAGLVPAPEADRRTLIRRVSFDLTGLPPASEEVEAFVQDPAPDAYEQLVERLLASPRYGERWARHWLDLVRYAESDGYRQDAYRPEAWRYRDYVIRSFNQDKPYDQFVTEQLAGDELDPGDAEMRVATSFLRLWPYEYNQRDVPGQWAAILNDLTDVTGDVFLGLGLGCARCHDHKFDPILQKDYYRFQAFFTPLLPRDDLFLTTPEETADNLVRRAAWDLLTADIREEIAAIERPFNEKGARDVFAKFTPELQAILHKPESERTAHEQQFAYMIARQLIEEGGKAETQIKGETRKRYEELKKQLASFDRYAPPPLPRAFTATDAGPMAPPTIIPGDRKQEDIVPGFLTLLDPEPASLETPAPEAHSTGRRLTLARWLTRPDNPLTTRVIVNRIWQYHFGRGLVATSSDFGRLGEPPTHPDLLDWLATEFVQRGWSFKQLHRLILTSATYRQSALRPMPEMARRIDPENRLLWRRDTTRLDAEEIRDAMLVVSGEWESVAGGPAVEASEPRRSIFTKAIRNTHDPLLDAFDAPDGSASTPKRNVTTTPTQSLLLINGSWTLDRARAFAERLRRRAPNDLARQVELAYRVAYGRPPEDAERDDALAFLDRQSCRSTNPASESAECEGGEPSAKRPDARFEAMVDFCHALLNSNEFLYVD